VYRLSRRIVPSDLLIQLYISFWDATRIKQLLRRIKDPRRLEHFGCQIYSQNEEDGIIAEIFRRIGTTNRRFVEFGCGDGTENNTRLLLDQGWCGLWIDGDKSNIAKAKHLLAERIFAGCLEVLNAFITCENINHLIGNCGGYSGEIDLLVIDIDGNDAHVWRAINAINPRVVCIEYNASCGPRRSWVMPYDPTFQYHFNVRNPSGASIKLLERWARQQKYILVGCNLIGVNAFFVRDDIVGDHFTNISVAEFFHPPRYRLRYAVKKALT
jgi:hypothetical protein